MTKATGQEREWRSRLARVALAGLPGMAPAGDIEGQKIKAELSAAY